MVQLTTSIVSQQYCTQVVDSRSHYPKLRLNLKLEIRNISNERLIIPRYGATIYRTILSKSVTDANAKQYAYDSYSVLGKFQLTEPDLKGVTPTEAFVVLEPSKSYNYEYNHEIDISLAEPGQSKTIVRPGDYFLQVTLQTWFSERQQAVQLEQRWAKYGHLWYHDLKSEPMLLTIERPISETAICR